MCAETRTAREERPASLESAVGTNFVTDVRYRLPSWRPVFPIRHEVPVNLTPPSFPTFFLSLLAGGAGIAAKLGYLPLAGFAFWLVALGFVLLLFGTLFRGL